MNNKQENRQQEIMKLQKLLFPILENIEIANQDKGLLRIVLGTITQESMEIQKTKKTNNAFAIIHNVSV